jgi:hypothetical protein
VTSLKSVEMAVGRVLLGGGGRRGPRDGVRGGDGRVAGWQWRCVAQQRVAVVVWQWQNRMGRVVAVILSGDKFKIGWNGSGEGAAWGGGRRGPRDGVREREWRVAGWQWRCVCSGLTSGSGYVAVCLSAWVGHCGHFEW